MKGPDSKAVANHFVITATKMQLALKPKLVKQHSSRYLCLCSTEERKSNRFGATWYVKDDRIVSFVDYPMKTLGFKAV